MRVGRSRRHKLTNEAKPKKTFITHPIPPSSLPVVFGPAAQAHALTVRPSSPHRHSVQLARRAAAVEAGAERQEPPCGTGVRCAVTGVVVRADGETRVEQNNRFMSTEIQTAQYCALSSVHCICRDHHAVETGPAGRPAPFLWWRFGCFIESPSSLRRAERARRSLRLASFSLAARASASRRSCTS